MPVILLVLLGSVLREGWGELDLVSSSINSFTQKAVCGMDCVPRTDAVGRRHRCAGGQGSEAAFKGYSVKTVLYFSGPPRGLAR